ncbi:MAG TPA: dihydrofolate reductase family protein [Gemmatimonas sp.]|uniref:dihydrofolate reductase family protein n=1 Tax=Gemmatimonas sp. TaxID=1962908 RepID=UPI002EDA4BE3
MRKLVTAAFVSLDGVMQAPGGPEEDTSGDFRFGGWVFPYADEAISQGTAANDGKPFELVLGRKTYDIFAGYWPHVDFDPASPVGGIASAFNNATKYVASRSQSSFSWQNSQWLGQDTVAAVRALKQSDGPDLLTQGSANFLQTLLAADLIDELRLLIYPVVLGDGKRLFQGGAHPGAFTLTHSVIASSGVIITAYQRAGDVRTGSFV